MTLEEKIAELRESIEGCGFQCHRETYEAALKALENEERYRWHDLRKDPRDLPREDGEYMIVYRWKGNKTGVTVETYLHVDGFHTPPDYPCIAWRETDPFTEVLGE